MFCAVELFRQYGFKSVTMDDIARRCGISKKTLYQYFDNKNSVVSAAMAWYKEGIRCQCDTILGNASNALEGFVMIKVQFDNMYKEMNPMALHELQRFYPEGYQQFKLNMENDVTAIKNNILQGIEEGLYREDIDADIISRYHMESVLMIMMPSVLLNDKLNLFTVNRAIMEHYIYGIVTPKGEKLYRKYKEQYLTK
ncbi:MAG: helix-turn-helix transcriptional regulator [Chitinophagaceae bacterium]|nr:helix-turn-helix transcriptional regulator [Chitinophagaceae bacterium]